MSSNSTTYDPLKCTYTGIQEQLKTIKTSQEACNAIANGICNSPHHFINVYKIYFCYLDQKKIAFLAIAIVSILFLFLWLNFVRRSFFSRPVYKLRKRLGISDFMAEATLVPLSFGIVSIAIRLNAAYKDVDFVFNVSSTVGSMFTLTTFLIATCAIVLRVSSAVDKGKALIDLIFIIVAVCLIFLVGIKQQAHWVDSVVLISLWVVYLAMVWWRGITESSKKIFSIDF